MKKGILAWHFVANDKKLGYGDGRLVKAGKTYSCKGEPVLCANGMHASIRAIDALKYAPGHFICQVEISGSIQKDTDKIVGTTRKVLSITNIEKVLHLFACKVAKDALDAEVKAGRTPDPRSYAAIEAKHKYLNGDITESELSAAESAAWAARSAARSAAWAARSAARSAAWAAESAAESAAWAARSAARSAAWAARSAAESAAWAARSAAENKQNKILEKMILAEISRVSKKPVKRVKR